MLKIIDERSPGVCYKKFDSLKPGTIFQFANDSDSGRFYLRTKSHETFGATLHTALPLFGDFGETVFLPDSDVVIINAELHILKGDNNNA